MNILRTCTEYNAMLIEQTKEKRHDGPINRISILDQQKQREKKDDIADVSIL